MSGRGRGGKGLGVKTVPIYSLTNKKGFSLFIRDFEEEHLGGQVMLTVDMMDSIKNHLKVHKKDTASHTNETLYLKFPKNQQKEAKHYQDLLADLFKYDYGKDWDLLMPFDVRKVTDKKRATVRKPCKVGQERNPATNRCKKISTTKSCPANKIRNPATGRCVLKTGAIGKRLFKNKKL